MLSWAIYTGYGRESKNNRLCLNPSSSLVHPLPFRRFKVMENNKRSAKEALNGSASSRQRLHRQEDASWGTLIALDQRAGSAQPLGSSLAPIRCQLPRYSRRQIDNDDLLASFDRTDQHLANCLSLAESTLAIIEDRSPPRGRSGERKVVQD